MKRSAEQGNNKGSSNNAASYQPQMGQVKRVSTNQSIKSEKYLKFIMNIFSLTSTVLLQQVRNTLRENIS